MMVKRFLTQQQNGDDGWRFRRQRLVAALHRGMVLHSSYSGIGSPETGLRMLGQALPLNGIDIVTGKGSDQTSSDWLICWSSCDNNRDVQRVMLQAASAPNTEHRCEHFFPSLLDKLDKTTQARIIRMRPNLADDRTVKEVAYKKMAKVISQIGAKAYTRTATAPCLIHGQHCPIAWNDPEPEVCDAKRRPSTMSIAGPTCTPWCSSGMRLGYADSASEPYFLWLEEVRQLRFDYNYFENSPNFPIRDLANSLQHFEMVHMTFGPEERHALSGCFVIPL